MKQYPHHIKSFSFGFTLVEILVVLVGITILSAMLFSVFANVKSRASRATCASNLTQIGLACQMYVTDAGRTPNGGADTSAWADRLIPYVHNTSVFECPSSYKCAYVPETPFGGDSSDTNEFGAGNSNWGSYDMNNFESAVGVPPYSYRHPADSVSVIDGDGHRIQPGDKNLNRADIFHSSTIKEPRHRGGSNCLFVDGHIKWMSANALRDNRLWTLGGPIPHR